MLRLAFALAGATLVLGACAHDSECEEREYSCPGVLAYVNVDGAVDTFEVRLCAPGQCAYTSKHNNEPIDCELASRFVERVRVFSESVQPKHMLSADRDGYHRLTIVTADRVQKVERTGTLLEPEMIAILQALARKELDGVRTQLR